MNPKRDIRIYRESITPVQDALGFAKARIWREEGEQVGEKTCLIQSTKEILGMRISLSDMAECIIHLPRVNAVEVTDPTGNGVVLYADWP